MLAESAFRGAAGQRDLPLRRTRALTYSNFDGPTVNILCEETKVSIDEEGVYTIQDIGLHVVTVASDLGDGEEPQDALFGHSLRPTYGTGLLGVGKTKRAIYVCASPLSLVSWYVGTFTDRLCVRVQSKLGTSKHLWRSASQRYLNPWRTIITRKCWKKQNFLSLVPCSRKPSSVAYTTRVHPASKGSTLRLLVSSQIMPSPSVGSIQCGTVFRYNVNNMFIGSVSEGGSIPTSNNGHTVLRNASFLATELLPHNPARGDGSFIRITGNDPSTNQFDDSTLAQTLNAFSHFIFVHTGGTHLLVDFQGMQFTSVVKPMANHSFQGFWERGIAMFVLIDAQGHSVSVS